MPQPTSPRTARPPAARPGGSLAPVPGPRPPEPASRVIYLHALAPAKPATGAACNGCGVCCASEPCPLGMWLSRRRRGACAALRWSAPERRYLCGALSQPAQWWPWLPEAWARRLVRRWIAAGVACDAELEVR